MADSGFWVWRNSMRIIPHLDDAETPCAIRGVLDKEVMIGSIDE
jgi:hypothetical protein